MSPLQQSHPQPDQLAAFACGQVPEDTAAEISQHLADCATCRTTIAGMPDDTLLSLLRQAHAPDAAPTQAGAATIATASDVPQELTDHPRYRVLQLLGSGGMGAVYHAEHRRMERQVALKVLSAELTKRPALVERFQREVKAAAMLTHANIVTAYDADQAGDIHFLVMEFVAGLSLAQRVQQQGPLPVTEACHYVRQAALGLQHAYERGMVHRDIKPHNLMLTPGGQVKILDFGLARLVRETAATDTALEPAGHAECAASELTEVGVLMGTADFIAPEQAADPRQADIRADIYSLGCTLYYLLAGHAPFPEGTALDKLRAHAERAPASLAQRRPDVPAGLARVVDRMMAKAPDLRYPTPAAVAEALLPFASPPAPRRRRRLVLAACLAAFSLLVAGVIYVQFDQGEFEIKTDDEQVTVLVNQKGVTIHDRAANRKYQLHVGKHRLRSGEYIVTELPSGVEFATERFTIQRGSKEVLVATRRRGDLRDEALRWFPADATFYGGRDMQSFKDLQRQQVILLTQLAERMQPGAGERFWKLMSIAGDIDRATFAYAADAKQPARSRIYLRLTGRINHQRVADWLRQEWPGAVVREQKGPQGERLTVAGNTQPVAPAWAVIGSTDLVVAAYQGVAEKHLEVVEQLLHIRAGRGESLASARARDLQEIPPGAWTFFEGEPPQQLQSIIPVPLVPWPRSIRLTMDGSRDIDFRFHGLFATAADAKSFADNVSGLKMLGLVFVKSLPIEPAKSELLASALNRLQTEVKDAQVKLAYQLSSEAAATLADVVRDLPLAAFQKMGSSLPAPPASGK
jgi:hypothetical protein